MGGSAKESGEVSLVPRPTTTSPLLSSVPQQGDIKGRNWCERLVVVGCDNDNSTVYPIPMLGNNKISITRRMERFIIKSTAFHSQ